MKTLVLAAVAALALPLTVPTSAQAAAVGNNGGSLSAAAASGCTLHDFDSAGATKQIPSTGAKTSISFADTGTAVNDAQPQFKSTLKASWSQSVEFTKAGGGLKSLRYVAKGKGSVTSTAGAADQSCLGSSINVGGSVNLNFNVARKGTLTVKVATPGSGYRSGSVVISGSNFYFNSSVSFTARSQVISLKVKPGSYGFTAGLSGYSVGDPSMPFESASSSFNTTVAVDFKGA